MWGKCGCDGNVKGGDCAPHVVLLKSAIGELLPGSNGLRGGFQVSSQAGGDTRLLNGNCTKSSFPLRYVQAADA